MNKEILQPSEIPSWILKYATDIDHWMRTSGYNEWEFGPICSRNSKSQARNEEYFLVVIRRVQEGTAFFKLTKAIDKNTAYDKVFKYIKETYLLEDEFEIEVLDTIF